MNVICFKHDIIVTTKGFCESCLEACRVVWRETQIYCTACIMERAHHMGRIHDACYDEWCTTRVIEAFRNADR